METAGAILAYGAVAVCAYLVGRDAGESRVRREWQIERLGQSSAVLAGRIIPPQGGSGTAPPQKRTAEGK